MPATFPFTLSGLDAWNLSNTVMLETLVDSRWVENVRNMIKLYASFFCTGVDIQRKYRVVINFGKHQALQFVLELKMVIKSLVNQAAKLTTFRVSQMAVWMQ